MRTIPRISKNTQSNLSRRPACGIPATWYRTSARRAFLKTLMQTTKRKPNHQTTNQLLATFVEMAKRCDRYGDLPVTVTVHLSPDEILSVVRRSLHSGMTFDAIITNALRHDGAYDIITDQHPDEDESEKEDPSLDLVSRS